MKLRDKWAIARCIDEGRPFPARLAARIAASPELTAYAEVLRTLESRLAAGALRQRPSPSLRGRTLANLTGAPTGGHVRAWALWSGAVALIAVALAVIVLFNAPVGPPVDPRIATTDHQKGSITLPNVTRLLIQPFAAATESLQRPFRSEADALAEDGRQMVDVVLAQFPSVTGTSNKQ